MKTLKTFKVVLIVLLVITCSSFFAFASGTSEKVTVTILETSDIHGTIAPWDYATDSSFDGGLAKAYTVIKQQRSIDPELLLVDCGDTLQDNMIQEFRFDSINPMIKAMNIMGYDAWELGNHEFNFEFENLLKAMSQSKATVLGGNIYKKDGTRFASPYIIKNVKGVRVAIFGIEAPHISRWEASNPEHFDYMTFTTPMEETGKIVAELDGKADVVIGLIHYGEDGEYSTEGVTEIAKKYGDKVDAFLIGHAHSSIAKTLDNGCVIMEPGTKGSSVGKLSVTLERKVSGGKWFVSDKKAELLPVSKQKIEADPLLIAEMQYVHDKSRKIANTVIGQVGADFLPSLYWKDLVGIPTAAVQDTAMIDLINKVQMEASGADVSLAALFSDTSNLEKGDFKKRDGVKIYKYDNTLMVVKITGKQLKDIMEIKAGDFFNEYKPGDVTISFSPKIRLYNYDMFAGVKYDIDISKPVGHRIVNVVYKGAPLHDDQELVLALNNYRYGGLSGAGLISSSPDALVYNSGLAIRDLISDYVAKKGTIMPEVDNNWKIIGADLNDVDAELIYKMIRDGSIKIPTSEDGRTPNIKALNAIELRQSGVIKSQAIAN